MIGIFPANENQTLGGFIFFIYRGFRMPSSENQFHVLPVTDTHANPTKKCAKKEKDRFPVPTVGIQVSIERQ